jgi:hypothetical protein
VEKLKDIKSFENISIDWLPYMIFIGICVIIIFIVLYFIFRTPKILTPAQKAIKALKKLDFTKHSKQIVYDFTINGKICVDERYKDEFYKIVEKLEPYKYRPNIENDLDEDLVEDMKSYIKVRL